MTYPELLTRGRQLTEAERAQAIRKLLHHEPHAAALVAWLEDYIKLYSPSSIFSITPVDRGYCERWSKQAQDYDFKPVPYIAPIGSQPLAIGDSEDEDEHPYGCICVECEN